MLLYFNPGAERRGMEIVFLLKMHRISYRIFWVQNRPLELPAKTVSTVILGIIKV